MFKVEYLSGGKWVLALEIGSASIAHMEGVRLSRQHLVRIQMDDGSYFFLG